MSTKRPNMSHSLYRLIYCSRNLIVPTPDGAAQDDTVEREVRSILATSRARNQAAGITGALLFTASGFAQVLEGPRDAVEHAFERINADPRHRDVTVLSFTPIERRSFPEWSMGFCGQTTRQASDPLANLLADTNFTSPRVTRGSDVLRMLENVVRREEEWIAA